VQNKTKEILKDIWRNYRVPILLGILLSTILTYHKEEMELIWYIVSMLIVNGGNIGCLVYGLIKYFKK
jgi:hypothetical protein